MPSISRPIESPHVDLLNDAASTGTLRIARAMQGGLGSVVTRVPHHRRQQHAQRVASGWHPVREPAKSLTYHLVLLPPATVISTAVTIFEYVAHQMTGIASQAPMANLRATVREFTAETRERE